jgi:hypothetical protein
MELWMKIAMAAVFLMMLPRTFKAYQYWTKHGPKAQPGDWQSVVFALGIVVLFVLLLIMSVQK